MRTGVIAFVAGLILATSCTHSTPNAGVEGSLTYYGGPTPGVVHNEPGEVVVYAEGGPVVARQDVKAGEGFRLPLTPGTYRLVGSSRDADCADQSVTVPEDQFAHLEIVCTV